MKKFVWLLVFAALVAGGVYLRKRMTVTPEAAAEMAAAAVETEPVIRGDLVVKVEATGQVVSNRDVDIKSKASGEIIRLPFLAGDRVRKGALILQLDPADEERRVQQAQTSLSVSQARLSKAIKDLAVAQDQLRVDREKARQAIRSAEVEFRDTQAKANRLEQLYAQEFASLEQVETARTSVSQSAIAVENARIRLKELDTQQEALALKRLEVESAQASIQSDKLTLDEASRRLKETRVFAPMNGVITSMPVQEGQIIASGISNVGGGTTIMTISDISRVFINAKVDESQMARIAKGMRVEITADAYGEKVFQGAVDRVAPKGVVEQNVVTFEVKIEVKDPDKHLLKPQMTANVAIVVETAKNALQVPVTAIRKFGPRSVVLVPLKPGEKAEDFQKAWGAPNATESQRQGNNSGSARSRGGPPPGFLFGGPPRPRSGSGNGDQNGGEENLPPPGRPVPVETGLSDGAMTEIKPGRLREGDEVIVQDAVGNSSWRNNQNGENNRRANSTQNRTVRRMMSR